MIAPLPHIRARTLRRALAITALAACLSASGWAASETGPHDSATEAGREAAAQAAERIRTYHQDPSNVNKAQAKAALATLDARIEQIEMLKEDAGEAERRRLLESQLESLKTRRNDLRADYNEARMKELKEDARQEWSELKGWVREKTGADRTAEAGREVPPDKRTPPRTDGYAISPEIGAVPIPNEPETIGATEGRKELSQDQQRLALSRIARDLEALEQEAGKLEGAAKERFDARIEAFQDRRDELERNFSDARYTALMEDIQSATERAGTAAE